MKKILLITVGIIIFPISLLMLMSKSTKCCLLFHSVTCIITIIGLLTVAAFGVAVEVGYNAEQYLLYSQRAMIAPLGMVAWGLLGHSLKNIREEIKS